MTDGDLAGEGRRPISPAAAGAPLSALSRVVAAERVSRAALKEAVLAAVAAGHGWREIGRVTGVGRQGARQRWRHLLEPGPAGTSPAPGASPPEPGDPADLDGARPAGGGTRGSPASTAGAAPWAAATGDCGCYSCTGAMLSLPR